jgi:hypothetical protein
MIAMEFALEPATLKVYAGRGASRTDIKPGNLFSHEGDEVIEFEDARGTQYFFLLRDYA